MDGQNKTTPADRAQNSKVIEPRPFGQFLMDLKKGSVHDELSLALQNLVELVEAHDKKGSLTLKLSIEPNKETVLVREQITVKEPEVPRAASLFFVDENNNLRREDPRQMNLSDLA